ncbi:MAG: family 16 glycoside hydrolase [Actinomycetota bacterium]
MAERLSRAKVALAALLASALALGVVADAGAETPAGRSAESGSILLHDNLEGYRKGSTWADSSRHGKWKSVFDGYGRVGIAKADSKVLTLAPKVADDPSETHAALVATTERFGDLDVSMRAKTVKQLRKGRANPWEVAWTIWHYQDNTHFYYLILKPNGWELGKADPPYPGAQRFLATGERRFPIGRWHDIRVRQIGRTMKVWANGDLLTRFTDRERPYKRGAVAVYNEDAKTYFDEVLITHP